MGTLDTVEAAGIAGIVDTAHILVAVVDTAPAVDCNLAAGCNLAVGYNQVTGYNRVAAGCTNNQEAVGYS